MRARAVLHDAEGVAVVSHFHPPDSHLEVNLGGDILGKLRIRLGERIQHPADRHLGGVSVIDEAALTVVDDVGDDFKMLAEPVEGRRSPAPCPRSSNATMVPSRLNAAIATRAASRPVKRTLKSPASAISSRWPDCGVVMRSPGTRTTSLVNSISRSTQVGSNSAGESRPLRSPPVCHQPPTELLGVDCAASGTGVDLQHLPGAISGTADPPLISPCRAKRARPGAQQRAAVHERFDR